MLGRTFACLGVLAILSAAPLLTAPARAAWGPFTSLPTTQLVSDPSCAAIDPTVGSAICGGIGPAGQLMFSTWNGSKWSAWTTVSVSATSAPSCANAETGQAVCAVRNSALQMVAYEYAKGAIFETLDLDGNTRVGAGLRVFEPRFRRVCRAWPERPFGERGIQSGVCLGSHVLDFSWSLFRRRFVRELHGRGYG